MLRAIRRTGFASLLSLCTLLCVVSLSVSTLFHSDTDDTLCNPALVLHDHSAHRIGNEAGSAPTGPEHCAVCHWLSLRLVETKVLAEAPGDGSVHLFAAPVLSFRSATLSRQPARAPPAA